ncbi:unnamed protein product [Bursaphelenchus xylophilus]|uniref:(pine wood nematode) hypothetical protein n=1 Tax=Bursaphelenchus xylophilus TaxID=6326 RepID=A0A1I7RLW1_BURXY|nr:unnamed protein product [Bursaphelenchus xylophilus]CAG9106171.1 unnamed protein product [Bursaphelenchus xylophilus]
MSKISVCSNASSSSSSSKSSILVSQNSTASHSDQHVRFTIPKFSEHVSFERDFFREPSPTPVTSTKTKKSKKNSKIPMDEVEMLRKGLRSQHGQIVHSDSDDDFVEHDFRRILA